MSASISWVCTAGHHWACTKCCPNNKCKVHRNRPITAVGRLWSDSIGGTVVCANGCIAPAAANAVAAATTHVCTKQVIYCGTLLGMRRIGELPDMAIVHPGRIAIDEEHAIAIMLSKTRTLTCELVQRGHYKPAHTYELNMTLCVPTRPGAVDATALIPMRSEVGKQLTLETVAIIPLSLWTLVRIISFQVMVRKTPTPTTNCMRDRYWRTYQLPRPTIKRTVYSRFAQTLVPTGSLSNHYPCEFPMYVIRNTVGAIQCCWCDRIYANKECYKKKCAPDTL
jgi:hypothetical protein